jgi:DNA-binding FadR family transcriptional regulator
MKSAEDGFDDTLEADIEFHKSIFEATNNPFFIQLKNFIETTLRVNIRFTNRKQAVTSAEYQVHQDIYQAIVDGNAQLAWQSASQTQQATMALVEKQLQQLS